MNSSQFNNLLNNSENIDSSSSLLLENIIVEFPFFQAAKAIQLKQFKKLNNFKYNETLKKVAAQTIDRKILFEFITSPNFENKPVQEIEILEDGNKIYGYKGGTAISEDGSSITAKNFFYNKFTFKFLNISSFFLV